MFKLQNVKFKHILDIDNLIIPQGKITCIVGESGSGKTTLLRLLNKLISCDSGEIFYNDQDLRTVGAVTLRRSVIMLPQTPIIFPGDIKTNLLIGLELAEKPIVDDDTLRQVLSFVKLHKDLLESSDNLSGGEKQRLALARVILLNPNVLLLDEPSASLDVETERVIIEKLVTYTQTEHKTLIMVTHSQKIAHTYSDNIIELSQGRVLI